MVSAKELSRRESEVEEEAWKVGIEANVTGRQLNPGVPSNSCVFFCPHEARGSASRKKRSKSTVRHSYLFSFFLASFSILGSFLYAHQCLCQGEARGSEEGDGRAKRAYPREEFFTTKSFAVVEIFAVY